MSLRQEPDGAPRRSSAWGEHWRAVHEAPLTVAVQCGAFGEQVFIALADLSARGRGERQLILLTAAVASSKPIVLLDEPTSQMDHALRARLSLKQLFAERTVLLASHDDLGAMAKELDRVVNLSVRRPSVEASR